MSERYAPSSFVAFFGFREIHISGNTQDTFPQLEDGTQAKLDGTQAKLDSLGLKANTTLYSLRAEHVTCGGTNGSNIIRLAQNQFSWLCSVEEPMAVTLPAVVKTLYSFGENSLKLVVLVFLFTFSPKTIYLPMFSGGTNDINITCSS